MNWENRYLILLWLLLFITSFSWLMSSYHSLKKPREKATTPYWHTVYDEGKSKSDGWIVAEIIKIEVPIEWMK